MSAIVFVYGTLKEGFANFSVNKGRRVPGDYETVACLPLYIIGRYYLPWLVNKPGVGSHVAGQLFEVRDRELARMDVLERVNELGWYTRSEVLVRSRDASAATRIKSVVYFGSRGRLHSEVIHVGPIQEFTAAHDSIYRRSRV